MTELPKGWHQIALGKLSKLRYGKSLAKSLRLDDGAYPVVGSAGVMARTNSPLVSEPCVVVGRKGNVGAVQYFAHGCHPIDTVYYLHAPTDVDPRFLTLSLENQQLKDLDSSTAIPSLRREDLENVQISLPSLVEQVRIIGILEEQFSRLDSALASIKMIREKAVAFRNSLLHSAFSGELTGGTEGWELLPVSKLGRWSTGRTPSTKVPENFGSEVPFVTPADLVDMGKISGFKRFLSRQGVNEARLLEANSVILVCIGATLGKVGWVDVPVTTNQQINALEPDQQIVSTKFAFYLFASPSLQENLWRQSSSTTLPLLNKSALLAIEVNVPPMDIQERIVSVLDDQFSRMDKALEVINQLEERIASQRRTLIHAAFMGKLTAKWRELYV